MRIQAYSNPLLLDFVKVCIDLPQDERDQLEAFTGEPYTVDGAAIGAFTAPGPKWVFKRDDNVPLIVGGFVPQRRGVWQDFLLTTPAAWEPHNWFQVTRLCRRAMDAMFQSGQAHRLECTTLASRTKAQEWFRVLGYKFEAAHPAYTVAGYPAVTYSRVNR